MQFGILPCFTSLECCLTPWPPAGTVYPWTALVLFYLQNLNSLIKGQAEVSLNEFTSHLVVLERLLLLTVVISFLGQKIATKSTKY